MKKRIYGNRFYVVNNRISRRWFCLEDNTEQSESNPRLRPGIYKARRDGCLEDSTQLICSFTFGSVRTRSKSSRITLMRRILSFHGFYFFLCCHLI